MNVIREKTLGRPVRKARVLVVKSGCWEWQGSRPVRALWFRREHGYY